MYSMLTNLQASVASGRLFCITTEQKRLNTSNSLMMCTWHLHHITASFDKFSQISLDFKLLYLNCG